MKKHKELEEILRKYEVDWKKDGFYTAVLSLIDREVKEARKNELVSARKRGWLTPEAILDKACYPSRLEELKSNA